MATATTGRKRVAAAPTPEPETDETAETQVAEASETPKVKRARRMPTATFEIVGEDLPKNPKRKGGGGGGGGKSKWIKVFEKIKDAAPQDAWVKVGDFPTASGATTAKRNMRKSVENGKLPLPEGVRWEVDSRRVADVDESGKPVGDVTSALFIRWCEGDGHNLTVENDEGGNDGDDGDGDSDDEGED